MLKIHLGAHKTASTHLQYSMRLVRDELRACGVAYVDPPLLRGDPVSLAQVLSHGPGGEHDADCADMLRGLRAECDRILISEENILGGTHRSNMFSRRGLIYPFAARRVRQVIALAGGGPATLYLGLRDPAGFNVSAFALQLSLGNEIELTPYLRGRDPSRSFWGNLIRRLSEIDEVERLIVWRYEDYRALRPRLLAHMLPQDCAGIVPEPPPSNESLTQAGYEWFLSRAMSDSESDLRELVRRARNRFPRSDGHRGLRLLDDAVHARSDANYAADIDGLRQLAKVEFLDP
ncbi:hypothetical protein [Paracoccus laeviglucosivorans]|uniref:Sulfotransferase family protein n=1 Tax=Paracoccus laeviglucosivorans TaxID=1197861 RepID=A0A521EW99_9RHOB|nr:hypothetical protein [Paracoccus laeviglucosivorans]SMO88193.1 hypothetical protein SAMN06265221_11638 [Paracoccus laeviglucosivorans]